MAELVGEQLAHGASWAGNTAEGVFGRKPPEGNQAEGLAIQLQLIVDDTGFEIEQSTFKVYVLEGVFEVIEVYIQLDGRCQEWAFEAENHTDGITTTKLSVVVVGQDVAVE